MDTKPVRFRTAFDTDYKSAVFDTDPYSTGLEPPEDETSDDHSQVQHDMAAECDVNEIMKRYQRTNELTHVNNMAAQYGDFSDVLDYKDGVDRINHANALFMELPARIRDMFNNDPAKFIDYATDGNNQEELRKMGLAPPLPEPPEPQLVKVVPEADSAKAESKPAKQEKPSGQTS